MTHSRLRGIVLAFLGASLVSSSVHALANRVFVSARSGNDANSCDNVLTPCQTFAGAVVQLNPGGEAIVLDSGGYGPVTITKALTIEAPPGVLAFIHPPSGDAITVNAGSSDTVILRGLTLNKGSAYGILINTAGSVHIENCVISGFAFDGIAVKGLTSVYVKDTISRGNFSGLNAAVLSGYASVSAERCRFEQNQDYGIAIVVQAKASVRNSVMSGNGNSGILASTGTATGMPEINVESCLVANNNVGILSNGGSGGHGTIRVSDTTVTDNVTGLAVNGGGVILSRGNNSVGGNGTDTFGVIGSFSPL